MPTVEEVDAKWLDVFADSSGSSILDRHSLVMHFCDAVARDHAAISECAGRTAAAEVAGLRAALGCERERANEWLSRSHDAARDRDNAKANLDVALGELVSLRNAVLETERLRALSAGSQSDTALPTLGSAPQDVEAPATAPVKAVTRVELRRELLKRALQTYDPQSALAFVQAAAAVPGIASARRRVEPR